MSYPYLLHPSAYEEYVQAYEWYELKQAGLGDRFMDSIDKTLELISNHPLHFNKVKGNYRSSKVKGFPYQMVFEFLKSRQMIHISAIYHSKRNPSKKFRRIKL